jgi:hypothetical protein
MFPLFLFSANAVPSPAPPKKKENWPNRLECIIIQDEHVEHEIGKVTCVYVRVRAVQSQKGIAAAAPFLLTYQSARAFSGDSGLSDDKEGSWAGGCEDMVQQVKLLKTKKCSDGRRWSQGFWHRPGHLRPTCVCTYAETTVESLIARNAFAPSRQRVITKTLCAIDQHEHTSPGKKLPKAPVALWNHLASNRSFLVSCLSVALYLCV